MFGANGFHVNAKNKRFTAASSRCHQNLKYEYFMSLLGRLRRKIAPKSVPHVQDDYFSLVIQSNHWLVALSLRLPSSLIKVPNTSAACMGRFSYLNGLCRSQVRELNVGAMFIEEDIACCRNQTNIQTNRHCMRVLLHSIVFMNGCL